MKKRVTVTISGTPKSGKSTIAQMVASMLVAEGIAVTFFDDQEPAEPLPPPPYKITTMAKEGSVIVNTVQESRRAQRGSGGE